MLSISEMEFKLCEIYALSFTLSALDLFVKMLYAVYKSFWR